MHGATIRMLNFDSTPAINVEQADIMGALQDY